MTFRHVLWISRTLAIAAAAVALAACPEPFDLNRVDRPPFDNPVDPDARVELLSILNGTDDNGDPLVPDGALRLVLAQTGVQYTSGITDLDAKDRGITSLEGLVYFPRLRWLNVSNSDEATSGSRNQITDLSPLFGHPTLEELIVSGVSSATAVDPALDNDLSAFDLALLAEVPRLNALDIGDAGVSDLAGLAEVGTLRSLAVSGGDLVISGTTPFPSLPQLTSLRYDDSSTGATPPTDFAFLAGCTGLETLSMQNSIVSTLHGIGNLTNLRNLNLNNGGMLTDIADVAFLTKLESLSLNAVPAELDAVNGLANLRYLGASHRSGGVPIGTLASLPSLTELDLSSSSITDADLAGLIGLTALRSLLMQNSLVSDLTPLSSLVNLTHLTISGAANAITLDALGSLSRLEDLQAESVVLAAVETFSFASGMTNLRTFRLSDLGGLYPTVSLEGFASSDLEDLSVSGVTIDESDTLTFAGSLNDLSSLTIVNSGYDGIASTPPVYNLDSLAGTQLGHLQLEDVEIVSSEDLSFAAGLDTLNHLEIINTLTGSRPGINLANLSGTDVETVTIEYAQPFNASFLPTSVRTLRLVDCGIDTSAGGGLVDEIAVSLPRLTYLDLQRNGSLRTVAALSFSGNVMTNLETLILNVDPFAGGISSDGSTNGVENLSTLPSLAQVNLNETDAARTSTHTAADPTGVFQLKSLISVSSLFTP